jgi:hypothetical protein
MNSRETYEFEHKVWTEFFKDILPTLPNLLKENPSWKEPLRKILASVINSGINHNNYIHKADLSGEAKLFLLTTLNLLDDPTASKPFHLDLWKRFWVKYGHALFEYNELDPLKWRAVWQGLSGYHLFQAPLERLTYEVRISDQ